MEAIRYRLIHLTRIKGATRKLIRLMLRQDPTLEQIYKMSSTQFSYKFRLSPTKATLLYTNLHDLKTKKTLIEDLKRYKIITILDKSYPKSLKAIPDAPLVLYALGDERLLEQTPMLSVIGTRNPSKEARQKLHYIVKPLLERKWIIVSGMAKGVDGFAHTFTLQEKGKTIAVLGGGFKHIYPKIHHDLFHSICRNGLVISEYPPNVAPAKHHFPERNRIISGLSFGTLVIEAMERSGTLITVEQALEQGREIFAVPSSPLIPQGKGCHLLIQDGAKLVQHANDIQEEWRFF